MTSGRDIAAAEGPVGYALALATRAHRLALQQRMADLGLHLGQELIVVDLHRHPGTTQAELVERMGMEQPTIAKALTRIERTGFVARAADPRDRRVSLLRLTAQGEAVVPEIIAAWADVDRVTTASLTDAETRELTRLLNKLRESSS